MCKNRILLSFLALTILAGCAVVRAQVSSFSTLAMPVMNKSIAVIGYPEETNKSLEFRSYRPKFEQNFRAVGFSIAPPDQADYIAFVSYGIDTGTTQTSLVSTPIYGQTGGGTTYTSGTVSAYSGGYGPYSGTSYTMPTYGVVGYSTSTVQYTTYKRQLAVDIVEASTVETNNPIKVYEGRLSSIGSCGAMSEVIDELIQALFVKFPNDSGKVEVKSETDC